MSDRERDALRALLQRLVKHAERGNINSVLYLAREAAALLDAPRKTIAVRVALPDRAICGNGKAQHRHRTQIVAAARLDARIAATEAHRVALGLPDASLLKAPYFPTGRVGIKVHAIRDPLWSRVALDDDNMQRGLKPVQDALQDALIVANDRQCYYDGPVTWEAGPEYGGSVLLTLTADEGDKP